MKNRRRPGDRLDAPVVDHVRMLAFMHSDWTPTQLHRAVNRLADIDQPGPGREVISLRSVQRIKKQIEDDGSGVWSLGDGDPQDAALAAPFARIALELRQPPLTKAQADYIARIQRAYPDLSAGYEGEGTRAVYWLAVLATKRGPLGDGLRKRVDGWLAFTPWRDEGSALARAVAAGQLPQDLTTVDVLWATKPAWPTRRHEQ